MRRCCICCSRSCIRIRVSSICSLRSRPGEPGVGREPGVEREGARELEFGPERRGVMERPTIDMVTPIALIAKPATANFLESSGLSFLVAKPAICNPKPIPWAAIPPQVRAKLNVTGPAHGVIATDAMNTKPKTSTPITFKVTSCCSSFLSGIWSPLSGLTLCPVGSRHLTGLPKAYR